LIPPLSGRHDGVASLQQPYTLPGGGTLTLTWESDRPITSAELDLLARLRPDR
jgi:hypothetical protein